ncbi:MAG TPA: tRNA uridine(34) 5-carboxymethylaminomethyl modification radical SAM/GNAT enzyme Elp3 [Candidatus Syntrophoarchaeum butanivorans]|uniref:tRNA carboxymethyluridine synthase n=1 Tax=Candidatus Syntropharchaeum butanivorans TaxID=1839936 RepID=A0A1F2P550_9EURY|nr:MAG: histone acetyltransferase, ELP3 family protein [Candidatus Syntrophoarchaeum butanivorans]HEC57870.1 tRNA uridine(34) 5-carboxymethylaminomethyl modification radical SAM/GNAT enzyme Elp3 [Candidatus Syntrophoarchaeum butanivorans]
MSSYEKACEEVARIVAERFECGKTDYIDLNRIKKEVGSRYRLKTIPRNSDIIKILTETEASHPNRGIIDLLRRKRIRTISGVAVVAAMTSPYPCPHGKCVVCPGGPDSPFKSPQSYTGLEPAALRGFQHDFDPYKQVKARLKQLSEIGHEIDKVELIVMGGTITSRPLFYQRWFVKRSIEAMNDFYSQNQRSTGEKSWLTVQKINETAKVRNTGITFETRPDCCKKQDIKRMLSLGVTKVELGVQHTDNEILRLINRGHTREDVIRANRLLRDSSLKVGFHMMPGLPGSDLEMDLAAFEEIFNNPDFLPDYLKIYPTLVVEGSQLEKLWRRGEYEPLTNEAAAELISRIKPMIPPWTRLQRVQRDIPAGKILAGVKKSNLRQIARKMMEDRRERCRCIRCREVGHRMLEEPELEISNLRLSIERYYCCGGSENFLSILGGEDTLVAFLRLRFPSDPFLSELEGASLIRELHVYGPLVPFDEEVEDGWQHKGYGEWLLAEAERISLDEGYSKIAVMSGIGVRGYYRSKGYEQAGAFMIKEI